MFRERSIAILALITCILVAGACSTANEGPVNNAAEAANRASNIGAPQPGTEGVKDGVEELEALIKFEIKPEDLVWKEFRAENAGSVQGRRILAVFQLTKQDAKDLVDRSSKNGEGTSALIPVEKWFPPELITQSDMSVDEGIAVTTYPADEFFKGPFDKGTISRVDKTDFFVLELFAT